MVVEHDHLVVSNWKSMGYDVFFVNVVGRPRDVHDVHTGSLAKGSIFFSTFFIRFMQSQSVEIESKNINMLLY